MTYFSSLIRALNTLFLTLLLVFQGLADAKENSCVDTGMVYVPAGNFVMGSDREEKEFAYNLDGGTTRKYGWYDIEVKKAVSLPGYCINRTPVTNNEYNLFVKETKYPFPFISPEDYQKQGFLVHPYKEVRPFLWNKTGYPKGLENHPVVLVSVKNATEYCQWRGRKSKSSFRLPTEEEWEKGARGTDGRYFPWGNKWDPEKLNSVQKGPYFTTEVFKYPDGKSPFGLLDVAGNIFEWTSNTFPNGKHVVKSCSWDDAPGFCRPAARHGRPDNSRHILIGFRCATN